MKFTLKYILTPVVILIILVNVMKDDKDSSFNSSASEVEKNSKIKLSKKQEDFLRKIHTDDVDVYIRSNGRSSTLTKDINPNLRFIDSYKFYSPFGG